MEGTNRHSCKLRLPDQLPPEPVFTPGIRRAPDRGCTLNREQTKIALKNALRYIPATLHEELAPEFLQELNSRGRIYGYRYRPAGAIKGNPVDTYPGHILEAKAFQVMIDNNLDFDVALYPYELVTYGESGQVFQNWMQYRLTKMYLEEMERKPDAGPLFRSSSRPLPDSPGRAQGHIHQWPAGRHVRQCRRISASPPPWAFPTTAR